MLRTLFSLISLNLFINVWTQTQEEFIGTWFAEERLDSEKRSFMIKRDTVFVQMYPKCYEKWTFKKGGEVYIKYACVGSDIDPIAGMFSTRIQGRWKIEANRLVIDHNTEKPLVYFFFYEVKDRMIYLKR